jgi:hypothetical protein
MIVNVMVLMEADTTIRYVLSTGIYDITALRIFTFLVAIYNNVFYMGCKYDFSVSVKLQLCEGLSQIKLVFSPETIQCKSQK